MKKFSLATMLVSAALFTGVSAVSLSANGMKCGAGKCGGAMEKPVKKSAAGKCGNAKKIPAKKCGAGKCGDAKKVKKVMKCGAGKCGSK